jgi:hypothetical protein
MALFCLVTGVCPANRPFEGDRLRISVRISRAVIQTGTAVSSLIRPIRTVFCSTIIDGARFMVSGFTVGFLSIQDLASLSFIARVNTDAFVEKHFDGSGVALLCAATLSDSSAVWPFFLRDPPVLRFGKRVPPSQPARPVLGWISTIRSISRKHLCG